MNEIWPVWTQNLSIIFSGVGIVVSLFLLYEAREIRKSFKRKATLPTLNKYLSEASRVLNDTLSAQKWDGQKFSIELTKLKAYLEKAKDTLREDDKKAVEAFISDLGKFSVHRSSSEAWYYYEQLQYIATKLEQTEKNLAWD
ncbi:hypothetical protein A3K86_10770 [Photobacterium jeanii]|uniref:DUF4760 domain-containing protein n=1 Tax=Photobacterium jeanii TaxID=858640 RepID=A0A178KIN8_9GAMM|nr:hypothetical protein [Photobacterium jeanii]OAN16472.1 hypothetical protein A3K86_10770 [Photobacterium jeanii]PST86071.1 hypothetical protein C9I91_22140 [Photobacterium jeanii]